MKRKCILIVLALVMVFGSVSVASAYPSSADIYTSRTSNTSATVSGDITYTSAVNTCTIKLTLQEKYNGSWRTAKSLPVWSVSKTRSKIKSMTLVYRFTLKKGKVYRIKGEFSSKRGSTSQKITRYTNPF